MAKTKELFQETLKAVGIAKNIEDEAVHSLPYSEQLDMLNESIKKAESREEFEAYENKIDDVKMAMKFNDLYYKLNPEERETIEHNYKIESDEALLLYDKKKEEAAKELKKALDKVFPLIDELALITNKSVNARYVEELLNENVYGSPMNAGKPVLGATLERYPESRVGYKGILTDLKPVLNEVFKALQNPERYKVYDNGRGIEIQKIS